jgi:hypothetical protein
MSAKQERVLAAQTFELSVYVTALQRVEAAGRFVCDQKAGLMQKGLGERNALLEALGEIPDAASSNVREVESIEYIIDRPGE